MKRSASEAPTASSVRRFGHAQLDANQRDILSLLVVGKRVVHLGAGPGAILSQWVLEQGADHVLAIDTALPFGVQDEPPVTVGLSLLSSRFLDALERPELHGARFDVGLLSWPANYAMPGLTALLDRCEQVVVVSCNVESTVCGDKGLWSYLSRRDVVVQSVQRRNVMLVYGRACGQRPLLTEERLGIDNSLGRAVVSFEHAYPADR